MENKKIDEKEYKTEYWRRISEFFGDGRKTKEFKEWLIAYVCANGKTGNLEMDEIFTTLKNEFPKLDVEKIRNMSLVKDRKKNYEMTTDEKNFVKAHWKGIQDLCAEKRDFTVDFMKWMIENGLIHPGGISLNSLCRNQTMSEKFIKYLISKGYLYKGSDIFHTIFQKQKLSEDFINSLFSQEYIENKADNINSICQNPWVSPDYKKGLCQRGGYSY